jgi:hypothetical protein
MDSLSAKPDHPFRTRWEVLPAPKVDRLHHSEAARTDRKPPIPDGSIPAQGLALD